MSIKRNSGMLVAGAILIALGLLSLFGQIFRGFPFWSYLWPLHHHRLWRACSSSACSPAGNRWPGWPSRAPSSAGSA